jgi:DNA-directed RNA polymerase beta' subunit
MDKNKMDIRDVREIGEIIFGIFSAEELKKLAVCKVDSTKLIGSDKNTGYGTVYDPRLGTIENSTTCETCGEGVWTCPGHLGYIELNQIIVHPLHYKRVVDFLRCFCIKCFQLLITEDQIKLNNFNRLLGVKRFTKILEKLEKIDMCSHCSQPQPDIKYTATDNSISMVYKQKDKDKSKVSIVLPVDEIKNIFDNISNKDVELLGFNPELMHPRNLVLTVFPVLPTCCRPYIISESNICDDDLTIQLVEIIKANNHLKEEDGVPISETKRQKYLQSLKFRISTFYNNSSGRLGHSDTKSIASLV